LAEALSAATGGGVEEVEEVDEVGDELTAGSAAVAVQASAEATANEVIRIVWFNGIPFFGVNYLALRGLIQHQTTPCHRDRVKAGCSRVKHRALKRLHWPASCAWQPVERNRKRGTKTS
jgi:hypothetical protein